MIIRLVVASVLLMHPMSPAVDWVHAQSSDGSREQMRRVEAVKRIPGLAAFWDFVLRENDDPEGRFLAHRADGTGFPLDAVNYVREYWAEGRAATYADFPLLGRGPFGQAVAFRPEEEADFRPTLLVPREGMHGSGLDVGGPGQSVSMAVWMIRQGGNHAMAGIWHEGTDLKNRGKAAAIVQGGRRQYALFAGLAANNGASAVHVSENGVSSFGDKYARNLATTERLIPTATPDAGPEQLDAAWSVAGFVFDNENDTVTAYLDGVAEDYWIENPAAHPFFQWPYKGWKQAQLRRQPGQQEGEDPSFPEDQFYLPPEEKELSKKQLSSGAEERVWELRYRYTRHRVTERRNANGRWEEVGREMIALRVNPFWFGHDLYRPATAGEGGPFTIGRVIHSSRSNGTHAWYGGVAVFYRALSAAEMRRLAEIGFRRENGVRAADLLQAPRVR